MKKKQRINVLIYGILFFISVLMQVLARVTPVFGEWYARSVYPFFNNTLGRILSIFPFSIAEILLYTGIVVILIAVGRLIKNVIQKNETMRTFFLKIGSGILKIAITACFLYTIGCGINYYCTPFSEVEKLPIGQCKKEELVQLCYQLRDELNKVSQEIVFDENGQSKLPPSLRLEAQKAMRNLGKEYPSLAGYYPKAKKILVAPILSYQSIVGIYSPFTIEANYNPAVPNYTHAFTICHELSHLKGFMLEDEANFIAYLACMKSDNPYFKYSALLETYEMATSALIKKHKDYNTYFEIDGKLNESIMRERKYAYEWWRKYRTLTIGNQDGAHIDLDISKASDVVNDAYLKINDIEDGTMSYGRMIDLLIAYQKKNIEP